MPRSRGSEMPQQRQSPRTPLHLRPASSEPNGPPTHHHHRGSSPRLEDNHRRSPRSPLHELPAVGNQRKRATRVGDLETKLDHAKEELRKIKSQLASAEAAKRDAQNELEVTKKMIPHAGNGAREHAAEEHCSSTEMQRNGQEGGDEPPAESPPPVEGEEDETHIVAEMAKEKNEGSESQTGEVMPEESGEEAAAAAVVAQVTESQETAETTGDAAKLAENTEVVEPCLAENTSLKKQLAEAEAAAAAARAREEEMALKLALAGEELVESKAAAAQLREQLQSAEGVMASLEVEMRKMRVQTEQWRKAAEEAAAVLTPTGEANADGPRMASRCGSMDKYVGSAAYEAAGGGFSGLWSPLAAVEAEGLGGGRRKGGGIRVFGDLWKRGRGSTSRRPPEQ